MIATSRPREKNGKLQRPSKAERDAATRAASEREMSVVLAQPHRRGDSDQRRASAWGRFCLRNKLARELFDAGERYGQIYSRWCLLKAGRAVEGHSAGLGIGVDPTPEHIERTVANLELAEAILKGAHPAAYPVIRHMVVDCPTEDMAGMGAKERKAAICGALALAQHFYGKALAAHPFA